MTTTPLIFVTESLSKPSKKWLLPHSGPIFELGQNATLLVDVQNLPKFQKCPLEARRVPSSQNHRFRRSSSEFDFSKFNTFDQISGYLESLEETKVIGYSHEGRKIYSVKLGNSRNFSKFVYSLENRPFIKF